MILGIDLENIVYYKDDTHYFVMTAKKQSLLKKGVILKVRKRLQTLTRTIWEGKIWEGKEIKNHSLHLHTFQMKDQAHLRAK